MNSVKLSGNVVADAEVRTFAEDRVVTRFRLAHNRLVGKDKEETVFVNVDVWGKAYTLKKGQTVVVDGFLRQNEWEDKASGEKRSMLLISANQVYTLGYLKSEKKDKPDGETKAATRSVVADKVPGKKTDEEDVPF